MASRHAHPPLAPDEAGTSVLYNRAVHSPAFLSSPKVPLGPSGIDAGSSRQRLKFTACNLSSRATPCCFARQISILSKWIAVYLSYSFIIKNGHSRTACLLWCSKQHTLLWFLTDSAAEGLRHTLGSEKKCQLGAAACIVAGSMISLFPDLWMEVGKMLFPLPLCDSLMDLFLIAAIIHTHRVKVKQFILMLSENASQSFDYHLKPGNLYKKLTSYNQQSTAEHIILDDGGSWY